MITECRNPVDDKRILAVTPIVAIEVGYNLYLTEVLDPTKMSWKSAAKAVDEFNGLAESFTPHGPERIYLMTLRLAANSFAQGILRRKRTLNEKLAAAKQEKEASVKRFSKGQGMGGFLIQGGKLLAVGGFLFALAQALVDLPMFQKLGSTENGASFSSLATAIGFTMLGGWVKSWMTDRKIFKLFRKYDEDFRAAHGEYVHEVVSEYRLSAQTAEHAWFLLTGTASPSTGAFENLLMGVIQIYEPEDAVKNEDGKNEAGSTSTEALVLTAGPATT